MLKKILRMNEIIKEEISQIILREINFSIDVLVTIVKVDTSLDSKHSKIYVNVLPSSKKDDLILDVLEKNAGRIQKMLIKKLNMRYVPRIKFVLDKSGAEVDDLTEVFKKIQNEQNSK